MARFNSVTIEGRLCRDAEIKQFGERYLMEFSIAHNSSEKDKEGNWQERVDFFDCCQWSKTSKEAIRKGQMVIVQGKLRQEQWEDKSGQKRSRVKIIVDAILFASFPPKHEDGSEQPQTQENSGLSSEPPF